MMKHSLPIHCLPLLLAVLVTLSLVPVCAVDGAGETLVSAYYRVDAAEKVISPILPGTAPEAIRERVLTSGDLSLSDGVKTGSVLSVRLDDRVQERFTLAVLSDLNGDGILTVSDLLLLKSAVVKGKTLTPAQVHAGDVNGDGLLTETDCLFLKDCLLGEAALAPHTVAEDRTASSVLLTPGETCAFGMPEDSIALTGDAVYWNAGQVRAEKPGVARLTCRGETLWVTVSETPLRITLPESDLVLSPGDSAALRPALNHPYPEAIRWSVSDDTIASVDGRGVVTARKEGTATLTATLPNGSRASRTLRVLPNIRSLSLPEGVVKIRHEGGEKTLIPLREPFNSPEGLDWWSSDPSVASVDPTGRVTGYKDGFATIHCVSRHGEVSASCRVKVCNLVQVALTFDDGPSEFTTGPMLDLLAEHDAHATFFMVGGRIPKCADLLCRMVQEGHELGYHTWAHSNMQEMTPEEIRADFSWFQNAAINACGQGATLFRSPYGKVSGTAMGIVRVPHVMWSLDTLDWQHRNPDLLCEILLEGFTQDGLIILMHDIHQTTYDGVKMALEEMERRDLEVEFLTVTDLLSRNGEPPRNATSYSRAPKS